MIDRTSVVYVFMALNYRDRLDQVSSLMKTRYDNYVIDHTNAIYSENET